jgi:hypothetical protein
MPKTQKLQRIANDFYPTPALLTKALLAYQKPVGSVLECCNGEGHISRVLSASGLNVHTDDITLADGNQSHDATNVSFWERWSKENIDWVITNPPYSLASQIIPLAFDTVANGGIAMLLRLSYLEPCDDRADWLIQNNKHLRRLIVFNPRPSFRADTQKTDSVTSAWFIWSKLYVGGHTEIIYKRNWR